MLQGIGRRLEDGFVIAKHVSRYREAVVSEGEAGVELYCLLVGVNRSPEVPVRQRRIAAEVRFGGGQGRRSYRGNANHFLAAAPDAAGEQSGSHAVDEVE